MGCRPLRGLSVISDHIPGVRCAHPGLYAVVRFADCFEMLMRQVCYCPFKAGRSYRRKVPRRVSDAMKIESLRRLRLLLSRRYATRSQIRLADPALKGRAKFNRRSAPLFSRLLQSALRAALFMTFEGEAVR